MRTLAVTTLTLGLSLGAAACTNDAEQGPDTMDATSSSGDGDGDGDSTQPGDGDGDTATSGDGDGDGDAPPPGDGDGDASGDGDGDGDDFESWCPICVEPVDGGSCNADLLSEDFVSFSVETDSYEFDYDETCIVQSVSEAELTLDCELHSATIVFELEHVWTPDVVPDEQLRMRASGYESEWGWEMDWRFDHADDSLAFAGASAYDGVSSVGFGALAGTMVHELCTPSCTGDTIFEDIGLQIDTELDGPVTLFTGGHAVIDASLEVWTPEVQRLACDKYGDSGVGTVSVFVAAIPG